MHNKIKRKNVQVSMIDQTFEKIESLKTTLHTDNRSNIVKTSIDIADLVAQTIQKGGQVILEDSRGNKQKIVIPGL